MTSLPPRAGVGFKADHARAILDTAPEGLWLEVHPENYMLAGGPQLAWLAALRDRHALSFHGVGASLGGPDPLDADHLRALKALIARFEPASVSEHATWSAAHGLYTPDLLPLPRTHAVLQRLCDQIDAFQSAIGRSILIENPSVYVAVKSEMDEPDFLKEACRRSGCRLLLDVNNVYVAAHNTGGDARAYIDAFEPDLIGEIHIAGHAADGVLPDLLIDTHGAPVSEAVWSLFDYALARFGPKPTLLERDAAIPPFAELMQERNRADARLTVNRIAA